MGYMWKKKVEGFVNNRLRFIVTSAPYLCTFSLYKLCASPADTKCVFYLVCCSTRYLMSQKAHKSTLCSTLYKSCTFYLIYIVLHFALWYVYAIYSAFRNFVFLIVFLFCTHCLQFCYSCIVNDNKTLNLTVNMLV